MAIDNENNDIKHRLFLVTSYRILYHGILHTFKPYMTIYNIFTMFDRRNDEWCYTLKRIGDFDSDDSPR